MKTEVEIKERLAELTAKLNWNRCPCGCEEEWHFVAVQEVNALRWVLGLESIQAYC